ncbi:MAG: antibiotic biosynthesis monooxygenase [Halodesulfurarchaeum sp.]
MNDVERLDRVGLNESFIGYPPEADSPLRRTNRSPSNQPVIRRGRSVPEPGSAVTYGTTDLSAVTTVIPLGAVVLAMIVVANRFRVAEGYRDEFVDRFRRREGAIEEQPGFVRFDLLEPASEDTEPFVALTYWESEEDFAAWTESDEFAAAHSGETPEDMFEGPPTLEVHEVAVEVTPEAPSED